MPWCTSSTLSARRSMAKGIELGIVNQLPVISNRTVSWSDDAKVNTLKELTCRGKTFTSRFEQIAVKHPLNTLNYKLSNPELYGL